MARKLRQSGADILKAVTDEAGLTEPSTVKKARKKRRMSNRMSRYLGKARRNR